MWCFRFVAFFLSITPIKIESFERGGAREREVKGMRKSSNIIGISSVKAAPLSQRGFCQQPSSSNIIKIFLHTFCEWIFDSILWIYNFYTPLLSSFNLSISLVRSNISLLNGRVISSLGKLHSIVFNIVIFSFIWLSILFELDHWYDFVIIDISLALATQFKRITQFDYHRVAAFILYDVRCTLYIYDPI